jgi:transposase-like protein
MNRGNQNAMPECKSTHIRKNSINKQGKQNHICVTYGRQFIDNYETHRGDDEKTQKECLTMYVNGMGFRGIERILLKKKTIINCRYTIYLLSN